MKIAIIGATGKSGKLLLKEALKRGHDVTAIVRHADKLTESNAHIIEKDLFDLTYDDIKDNDVIIDAFGVFEPEKLVQHQTTLKHLADILSQKPNRLLVVGGAGSLYVNPEHTVRVMDTAEFPDEFKPLASNMAKALEELRKRDDVQWTYLSPAGFFVADGPRTGHYTMGGEEIMVNSKGESQISYADYTIAMIDEAETGKHIQQRFTVVSE
ncbi:NAD(P)-dependent oxidoreductase [Orbaceae bacterium ESL0721]|nr:NAD(P)-dependent oxidoreductase [Orbaceae bacterium ESL0721]